MKPDKRRAKKPQSKQKRENGKVYSGNNVYAQQMPSYQRYTRQTLGLGIISRRQVLLKQVFRDGKERDVGVQKPCQLE